MKTVIARPLIILSLCLGLAAPAHAVELYLSAASSLKEVVTELTARYAQEHRPDKFVTSFGATGVLAKQIENGAPADLFIAANEEWISYLAGKDRLARQPAVPLAYNSLVFCGRPGSAASGLPDLPRLARIAIGTPKSVPAGEYALAALNKAGLGAALTGKLVMAKDVRECLLYAERGEVDGALVYRTDALLLARQTRVLFPVPPELHARISYPLALTKAGAEKAEAVAFFTSLQSAAAKELLTRYGFVVP